VHPNANMIGLPGASSGSGDESERQVCMQCAVLCCAVLCCAVLCCVCVQASTFSNLTQWAALDAHRFNRRPRSRSLDLSMLPASPTSTSTSSSLLNATAATLVSSVSARGVSVSTPFGTYQPPSSASLMASRCACARHNALWFGAKITCSFRPFDDVDAARRFAAFDLHTHNAGGMSASFSGRENHFSGREGQVSGRESPMATSDMSPIASSFRVSHECVVVGVRACRSFHISCLSTAWQHAQCCIE
jgi:hypothetical protein